MKHSKWKKKKRGFAFAFNSLKISGSCFLQGKAAQLKPTCAVAMLPFGLPPALAWWRPWLAIEVFLTENHGWKFNYLSA